MNERKILERFGVNVNDLLPIAEQLARLNPSEPLQSINSGLPTHEQALLASAGAIISNKSHTDMPQKFTDLIWEHAAIIATSLNSKEAANILNVTPTQLIALAASRKLYCIEFSGEKIFPKFQFHRGTTLPHLANVLKVIDLGAHPVAVNRFFTLPHTDLQPRRPNNDEGLSPVEWLTRGHDASALIQLAMDL